MWTREDAIAAVVLASDGFGRAYGADLETRPSVEDIQPCVVELARVIIHLRRRGLRYGEVIPRKECARRACEQKAPPGKKYCSSRCAIRESARRRAFRKRLKRRLLRLSLG